MITFQERLAAARDRNDSLLCVGLDIEPDMMAERHIPTFLRDIVQATSDLVCAYSIHLGFYESLGAEGTLVLEDLRALVPGEVPVIAQAYRNDQSLPSSFSARGIFDVFGFDAVTINAYPGLDAVEPFVAHRDKGVFVQCRTNNKDADMLQMLPVRQADGSERPLYQEVAVLSRRWNDYGNVGIVVAPMYPEELQAVRRLCPDQTILVPEISPMSGGYAAAVRDGADSGGAGVIVSMARPVLYASRSENYAEAARTTAERMRQRLNGARPGRTTS